jgi:NCS1 family nucleobase:cation symporter-1
VGWLVFGVLVVRELDESFADGYSTVVSLQNIWPRVDRRIFTEVVCGAATLGALLLDINGYFNFLVLLASVLVPLTAVFLVDYFGTRSLRAWDVGPDAPARPQMLLPWVLGFAVYQLIDPGGVGWWSRAWGHVDSTLHFTVQSWMSASVLSFCVSGLVTVPFVIARRRSGG